MESKLTIGELSKEAGVPTSTVRYYERKGLLTPARRSASNYRLYTPEDLHRLRFIRAAQASGFTLRDVEQLLCPSPCKQVQQLIQDRLEVVSERMKELRHVEKVLRRSLATCMDHERSGRCEVIDQLSATAAQEKPA